jgi:methyl-accepting chemotaxis protein
MLSFSIPVLILLVATAVVLSLLISSTLNELIEEEGKNTVLLVKDLASETYQLNQERTNANGAMALDLVNGQVVLDQENPTRLRVEDQTDSTKNQNIEIPTMTFGGRPFAQDHAFVDRMESLLGGTFTIFQRIPQGLLRISTNIRRDGQRVVGTYIPTSSQVFQRVSRGETFRGRAQVVGKYYITVYSPLRDVNGDVVGVVYAGVEEANLDSLTEKIREIKIQDSGYVSIFNEMGDMVIGPPDAQTNVRDEAYFKQIKDEGLRELSFVRDGREWKGFATEVEAMKWFILEQVPVDEINAPLTALVGVLIIAMLILLIVTVIISYLVGTYLVKPIHAVVEIADRVAAGDLNTTIDFTRNDEIGQVASSMQNMLVSLKEKGDVLEMMSQKDFTSDIRRASQDDGLAESLIQMRDALLEILSSVQIAADQVVTGSDQVSSASQNLSQGATESAASLEEISSSINQVSGQAKQNAQGATEANRLAEDAKQSADKGDQEMQTLQEAMKDITSSAIEIGKVVKTIDDIAFQINLLALNANVEAARAGKYGRGFAVVAEEVRNLAVRSGQAVQETTEIVETALGNIQKGDELTKKTAEQLRLITGYSSKVAQFLVEIAAASEEQSDAMDQISKGLEQVDLVTQSNTASAEETASAAEELAGQAKMLLEAVRQFKLRRGEQGPYLLTHKEEDF